MNQIEKRQVSDTLTVWFRYNQPVAFQDHDRYVASTPGTHDGFLVAYDEVMAEHIKEAS